MRTAVCKSRCFTDKKEGVLRRPGDSFSCSDERAEELEGLGLVTLEPKPKKTTTKKKTTKE